ncbi:peptide/nickel transport system substrate-binding protein [Kitasatospora sp. MAP12-15]|uniref:ABC transporter substrate-binding protein n=1 Tax=unclassified Kitasatospora TaxID=2633591 RepID=UPI00247640AA|nr:ABC transporter substrate-binding protein [Kitasatospora sp. MAP12-44]MDH6109580.1 peptide/nickel transport system substrate-binding protein [Kitasatospora sp. MAP12-44]
MTSAIRRAPGRMAAVGCALLVATTVSGCGSVQSAVGGGGSSSAITMGTTEVTSVLDPAGAYDQGAWLILNNTFQSLLSFPVGATSPQPDAAQSCQFTGADAMTYQCTMRSGLTFSNGHPLTAQDVVFSMNRMKSINDPNGPAGLFDTVKSVEAPSDSVVVFHLTQPDAVLPDKLASGAGSIVDHSVFPANKELPNAQVVGSGPYKIDSIDEMTGSDGAKAPGKIVMSANSHYQGDEKLNNSKFTVRFFNTPVELKTALDAGDVDLTDNSLDPNVSAQLEADQQAGKGNYKVAVGEGSDTRFLLFNTKDQTTGQLAVRQAVAQLIDRDALISNVYARTVEPLYSVVPQGIGGHTTAFFDKYGDPDPAKAKAILSAAKVQLPVKLSLTWSRASAQGAESAEIKKQLEASGLFQVTVHQEADWTAFKKGWADGSYQAYTAGWTADYPDADDFVVPLVVGGGAYHTGYDNAQITQSLVPQTLTQADRSAAAGTYGTIQNIIADTVPMVPLFQNKSFYVSRNNITGVESTIDSTGVFRFANIGRS